MFVEERQKEIVRLVQENGRVIVKQLSEQFGVTEDLIRKDLTVLEKKGLLKKTYGGAVRVRVNLHDYYVSQRRDKNQKEKLIIAQKALELIENGDTIFLDISTVNLELARLIVESGIKVTVVTNMVEIMMMFNSEANAELIMIGGTLNRGRDGLIGLISCDNIKKFMFDKAFMGVVGVDLEKNLVQTYTPDDGITKHTALQHSRIKYMLLETRKLEMDGSYNYAGVDQFNGAIMEKMPKADQIKLFDEYKVKIV